MSIRWLINCVTLTLTFLMFEGKSQTLDSFCNIILVESVLVSSSFESCDDLKLEKNIRNLENFNNFKPIKVSLVFHSNQSGLTTATEKR